MRTLDRYLLKESFVPFCIGTFAVVIMLLGGILYDNAGTFFGRNVPIVAVAQLLLYRIPYLLVLTLPAGTVVAVSLVISRASRDSEITVMRTSGLPLWRIFMPLFVAALGVSIVDFAIQELVMPNSQDAFQKLFYRMQYLQPEPNIRPNIMFQIDNYGFSIGESSRQKDQINMQDITILQKTERGSLTLIKAKSGLYDAGKWSLNDVWVHQVDSEGNIMTARPKKVVLNLRADFGQFYTPPFAESLTMRELAKRIAQKKHQRLDTQSDEVNFHSKVSVPMACFVLALISPILALLFSRSGSFVGVLLSIILVFVYWNTLLLFVKILGTYGLLPPALSAWSPNLLFGGIGLYLLKRADR